MLSVILLVILSVLMFICVVAFGFGGLIFLAGMGSDHDFVSISGLCSVCGLIGMFVLTIPYVLITGY